MPKSDREPRELSRYIHLFLSEKDEKREGGSVPSEHAIWVVFTGFSPFRGLFSSGIASFISRRKNLVTLIEVGEGLPNSGYYFALDPRQYLLPAVDIEGCINKWISPSLRYACAGKSGFLNPFSTCFRKTDRPHFIISAFNYPGMEEKPVLKRTADQISFFSCIDHSSLFMPDVFLVINSGSNTPAERLLRQIAEFAPDTPILWTGEGLSESAPDLDIEEVAPPEIKGLGMDSRRPPDSGSFLSFMNTISQKISMAIKKNRKTAAG